MGLLKGDASFFFNKQDPTVRVTLVTTTPNRVISHLDEYSGILASCTKLINISDIKGENKPISYPSPAGI